MSKKRSPIFFLFTREQWLGVAILVVVTGITLLLLHFFQPIEEELIIAVDDSTHTSFETYQLQQDSLRKKQWKKTYPRDTIAIHLQPFDPNTADSSTLIHLGVKKWQASNLLKYRAKGGRYRQPEDMKKLYGMSDSMYLALYPYIKIDTAAVDHFRDSIRAKRRDSIAALSPDTMPQYISHKRDTTLNLRTTDTTELQLIQGIGSYRAKQIIRYRERLGGFVSVEQLREIKALQPLLNDSAADSIFLHFYIDTPIVAQLRVNVLRPEQLNRHPYISFEQAQAIYELRRKKIQLHNLQQLNSLPCFTPDELQRLAPYLSFESRNQR